MAHKSKDTLRLEEYCEAAGLTKNYCKQIGEISLHYYQYSWLPSMIMKETADTLPVLRDAIIMLGDRNRPYTKKDLTRAVQTISRLDLFFKQSKTPVSPVKLRSDGCFRKSR